MLQHHRMSINNTEALDITVDTPIIAAKEDAVRSAEEIFKVAKVVWETVI